jgi:hypothetical protein
MFANVVMKMKPPYIVNSLTWLWKTIEVSWVLWTYLKVGEIVVVQVFESVEDEHMRCHIVLFSNNVHVWVYSILNFWKNFIIFLHIMLEYNIGKILNKKLNLSYFIKWKFEYICEKNVVYPCILKHKHIPIFKKWFKFFMEVENIFNHVILHSLNRVWIPCD